MAGHSVPIDFWTKPENIVDEAKRNILLQDFIPIVEAHSGILKKITTGEIPGGHYLSIYASETMSLTVKLYCNGLVSSTLEYFMPKHMINEHRIVNDDGRSIENQIYEKFGTKRSKVLPALKRCPPINPYYTSSDDRILEYDSDKLVFEEHSKFQKVQIVHTKSFGNLLILDDLQNLAESDLSYTRGLMNIPEEKFKGRDILILGGGDGALLCELLKEEPNFITMIDIDEVVMKACREHMRTVCGSYLDSYDGLNYKVIVGDAIAYMKEYIKEDRKFDYVFADLTDIPISDDPKQELWAFMRSIMNLGIKCIKPNVGKYITHALGIQCESALALFEEQIQKLDLPVKFSRTSHYVPSFMEYWCFYQITTTGSS